MKPRKIKQEYSVKNLPAAGSEPELSAMIGGVANKAVPKSSKKGK
jgi:hypothetical protein